MATPKSENSSRSQQPAQVSCEVCQRLMPSKGALYEETEDYVFWFCGQDCYAKWQHDNKGGAHG